MKVLVNQKLKEDDKITLLADCSILRFVVSLVREGGGVRRPRMTGYGGMRGKKGVEMHF